MSAKLETNILEVHHIIISDGNKIHPLELTGQKGHQRSCIWK